METVTIEFKKLLGGAKMPTKNRNTDVGYDIYAPSDHVVPAKNMVAIHTGIITACPPGYYITVEGRSGMGSKGIIPFRGIIDSTYCGELVIPLNNLSNVDYVIHKGNRIAQIILHKQYNMDFTTVEKFSPLYDQRGIEGFGASGL